jgi:hypothetical protein
LSEQILDFLALFFRGLGGAIEYLAFSFDPSQSGLCTFTSKSRSISAMAASMVSINFPALEVRSRYFSSGLQGIEQPFIQCHIPKFHS